MFLLALLVACTFQPEPGVWTYAQTSVDEDSCGLSDYLDDPPGEFEIRLDDQDPLVFHVDDGTNPSFECTLDDHDFSCPDRFPATTDVSSVTLSTEGEAHGVFADENSGDGGQSATFDCLDLTCETAAALLGMNPPCEVEVSFIITYERPL